VRRLLASARPHLGALVVGTVLALLAGVAGLLQPLLAKQVIDALSAGRSLLRPVLVLGALVVAAALLGAANSYVLGRTAERVVLDVRNQLAERLVPGAGSNRTPGKDLGPGLLGRPAYPWARAWGRPATPRMSTPRERTARTPT